MLGSLLSTEDRARREHKRNSTHSVKRNQRKANLESLAQRSIPKVNRGLKKKMFLMFYLFLRERETEYEQGRGGERRRHRIGSRLQGSNL